MLLFNLPFLVSHCFIASCKKFIVPALPLSLREDADAQRELAVGPQAAGSSEWGPSALPYTINNPLTRCSCRGACGCHRSKCSVSPRMLSVSVLIFLESFTGRCV